MGREAINIGGNLSGVTVITKNLRYCTVDQRFPNICAIWARVTELKLFFHPLRR
jgi:hypothetical protein